MSTSRTFFLPKQNVATFTSDAFASGFYWNKDQPGSTPGAPKSFIANTVYKIGPFNNDTNIVYQVLGAGNVTVNIDYVAENTNQAPNITASVEDAIVTVDYKDGVFHHITFTEDTELAFRFPPGVLSLLLKLTNGGSVTVTWPSINWAGGTQPTLTSSGDDLISILQDGNGDIYGLVVGQAMTTP